MNKFFDEKSQIKATRVTFIGRVSKDISICQEGFLKTDRM
jgi:hypothetical protein